ncbi:hypothetical protein EV401DRAFT_1996793 [Pisolithus croceorrhizus]|nr:hypothetical protein EV401DRAFT_1996793 [Pisolithus croceorrhizus]
MTRVMLLVVLQGVSQEANYYWRTQRTQCSLPRTVCRVRAYLHVASSNAARHLRTHAQIKSSIVVSSGRNAGKIFSVYTKTGLAVVGSPRG